MASNKAKFEIEANVRHEIGKGASRRLRREEKVPAVIYGGGKEAVSLTLEHKHISKALQIESFYSRILTLITDGQSERVILKDVQRHPVKPRIVHVDFQRVRADEKLHMHIPLHFIGGDQAPGIKEGGVISHIMSDVQVTCLPDKLPEYLELDLSNMGLNQIYHLSDIKLPEDVDIADLLHGNDKAVASLHVPRVEEEPVIEAEAPIAPAEVPAIEQKAEGEGETAAAPKEEKKGRDEKK